MNIKDLLAEVHPEYKNDLDNQFVYTYLIFDITDQTGKGNKDIVEIYGKEAFEIMEHTLTVKIPYNKLAMDLDKTSNDTQNGTQKSVEGGIISLIKGYDKITR